MKVSKGSLGTAGFCSINVEPPLNWASCPCIFRRIGKPGLGRQFTLDCTLIYRARYANSADCLASKLRYAHGGLSKSCKLTRTGLLRQDMTSALGEQHGSLGHGLRPGTSRCLPNSRLEVIVGPFLPKLHRLVASLRVRRSRQNEFAASTV
jgi:hypothetical protein